MNAKTAKSGDGVRQNELKWTSKVMKSGWTAFPSVLLERQKALGLDAVDINILLHLIRHWWFVDNKPHPSKKTIAECMEIDESTVRRRIAAMEAGRLLKRVQRFDPERGQQSNSYDLSGLVKALQPFAEEALRDREQRQKQNVLRRRRKRPVLQVAG
jgi:predicted transcriptional regulator